MFSKILIANRGEIACRVIRTCKRLGIKSVAVYSDADANAIHTRLADERYHLGGSEAKDSYLNIEKIVKACKETGAQAVHPGYGFLSENADFARALAKAKITFIGPKPETIELMGDKVKAKEFANKCKAPLIPGINDESKIKDFIKKNGFPILIKAAAGGGGRGMRKVSTDKELTDAIKGAKREAETFFKDERIFVEKLVENGRHIEVQMFGDTHGHATHLFDRDCTAQRRHQKVLEEAPSFFVPEKTRQEILKTAVTLCKESGYVGAGTAEFLLAPDGKFYFLEVNSRLQVEHPATESITGLDLVELQIKVAAGAKLKDLLPKEIPANGYAIEARVCAESPENNFMTSTGKILKMNADDVVSALGIRIDTGFGAGDSVTHYYDSLLAKVITHGATRNEALQKLRDALKNLHILGIKTNIPFLLKILESTEFGQAGFHVNAAADLIPDAKVQAKEKTLAAALGILAARLTENAANPTAWTTDINWRPHSTKSRVNSLVNDSEVSFALEGMGNNNFRVVAEGGEALWTIGRVSLTPNGSLSYLLDGRHHGCRLYAESGRNFIATHLGVFEISEHFPKLKSHRNQSSVSNEIKAPFPGKVVSVKASIGGKLAEGDSVIVLESMKMEHPLKAPLDGVVEEISVKEGDVIEAGRTLARLTFIA
jgi:3-methylcrotonyl-CoA carboxylase alpha subunit